jgi:uncharacterized protein (TIGR00661 family)
MRVLYAIQGTGNGHLSRARDIIPALERKNIQLDILVSGTQADVQIPYPITYRLKGLSFIFGKKGGVDLWRTYLKANSMRLQQEISSLPVNNYDLVINDFEPVSAWACKLKNKPCVSLSHQAAVLAPGAPQPDKKDPLGKMILQKYAPASLQFGFHFKAYQDRIFTPVIRQDIRQANTADGNYYTVYLPSYDDQKLIKLLSGIANVQWQVFSKHFRKAVISDNLKIMPVTNEAFVRSMAGCSGVLCGAGFETPAEALYLHKKLMVIPMKGQYEQQCNMAALKEMGVPVLKSLKKKHLPIIREWIDSGSKTEVHYPDLTAQIIDQLFEAATVPEAHLSPGTSYV